MFSRFKQGHDSGETHLQTLKKHSSIYQPREPWQILQASNTTIPAHRKKKNLFTQEYTVYIFFIFQGKSILHFV